MQRLQLLGLLRFLIRVQHFSHFLQTSSFSIQLFQLALNFHPTFKGRMHTFEIWVDMTLFFFCTNMCSFAFIYADLPLTCLNSTMPWAMLMHASFPGSFQVELQFSLNSHSATPLGQLGYTSMRNPSAPRWPLYLMFARGKTCCCAFPTVRGALKIKIFQIPAKRWRTSNWFSIVAKQHQEPRPAFPPCLVLLA